MSQTTRRILRDLLLEMIDPHKPSESRFDPRVIDQVLIGAFNKVRSDALGKDTAVSGHIDAGWFTEREIEILWDTQGAYIPLDHGAMDIDYDQGIRIETLEGLGQPFVHFPTGWCKNYPDLAYAEGNIVWEVQRGKVRFPNLSTATQFTAVRAFVIEDDTSTGLDEPIAIPSEYQLAVLSMALEMLGIARPEDRRADSKPINAT